MKIIVLGKQNHLHWIENVYETFKTLGHNVKLIAVNKLGISNDINRNLLKYFNKDASSKYNTNLIENRINKFKPDMVFVISPLLLDHSISYMIGSLPTLINKIAWIGDRFASVHKPIVDNYDLIYCTDSYFVKEAKEFLFPTAKYLPLAVNNNIFFNKNLEKRDELLFIGSPTNERVALFNSLNIEIKLVGKKWKKSIKKSNIEILNKNISINEVAKEYNNSKFILNIKHEHNVVNGLNMRSFEVPAVGSCLIQDNVKDLQYNFDIDKEMVIYNNKEEISEIITQLIRDKKRTQLLIKNAQKCIESKHLYKHRLKLLLEDIK